MKQPLTLEEQLAAVTVNPETTKSLNLKPVAEGETVLGSLTDRHIRLIHLRDLHAEKLQKQVDELTEKTNVHNATLEKDGETEAVGSNYKLLMEEFKKLRDNKATLENIKKILWGSLNFDFTDPEIESDGIGFREGYVAVSYKEDSPKCPCGCGRPLGHNLLSMMLAEAAGAFD